MVSHDRYHPGSNNFGSNKLEALEMYIPIFQTAVKRAARSGRVFGHLSFFLLVLSGTQL